MFVLKRVRIQKLTSPIQLVNSFSIKRQLALQNEIAFKNNSYSVEKYHECIKNGMSSKTIDTNKWIFSLNTSQYTDNLFYSNGNINNIAR